MTPQELDEIEKWAGPCGIEGCNCCAIDLAEEALKQIEEME